MRARKLRDAEATRQAILAAATAEFARKGLGGARVDAIAARARANKRMIYHYFGSKEKLFTAVLEEAYGHIRSAELKLPLAELEPEQALAALLRFTWDYYLARPEFLSLVNSANLHKARHVRDSQRFRTSGPPFVGLVKSILDRGVAMGVFRPGIDPVQLNITMAAVGYYYLTNRFTGEILFERDFMTPERLAERYAFNLDTILRLVRR
ncbi:TetR/AcrR family transcriptional regulator [Taklimakanibacter lacteus]|uniref:TetR/AcrR family transcriptional regulator n=1 Tax=Taklimakanibacter lacteus TaxID=2268456 RepID=UPI0034D4D461